MFEIDNKLTNLLENKIKSLYEEYKNKIEKDNDKGKYIINSNYFFYKLKKQLNKEDNNLKDKEIKKIEYVFKLNKLCFYIRKKYIHYLVFSSKINNIYNMDNEGLIFMGEKYLFIEYSLKDKDFAPCLSNNFLSGENNNFNNYEIKYLSSDLIIMNNYIKKIIYLIESNIYWLIKMKNEYYSNIIANDKYLLFDTIKENNIIQFNVIDLSNKTLIENNNITELLNTKVEYNYP